MCPNTTYLTTIEQVQHSLVLLFLTLKRNSATGGEYLGFRI